jgi:Fic family protein
VGRGRPQCPGRALRAAAAAIAFGFVYVHPFVDGNGRIHRWLIHHVLAAAGYNPPGIVFPISAVILRRVHEYRAVLEAYSAALLPLIEWTATADGNLTVHNDTADFYRYFDATAHAEFLHRASSKRSSTTCRKRLASSRPSTHSPPP